MKNQKIRRYTCTWVIVVMAAITHHACAQEQLKADSRIVLVSSKDDANLALKSLAPNGGAKKLDTKLTAKGKRILDKLEKDQDTSKWSMSKTDWVKNGGSKKYPAFQKSSKYMPFGAGGGKWFTGTEATQFRSRSGQHGIESTRLRLARESKLNVSKRLEQLSADQHDQIKSLNAALQHQRESISKFIDEGKPAEVLAAVDAVVRDHGMKRYNQILRQKNVSQTDKKTPKKLRDARTSMQSELSRDKNAFSFNRDMSRNETSTTQKAIYTIINQWAEKEEVK